MRVLARAAAAAALACSLVALPVQAAGIDAADQVAMLPPAAGVGGVWCGDGPLQGFTLDIAQHARDVEGKLIRKGRVREITGHVEGAMIRTDPQRDHVLELQAVGEKLRVTAGTGILALLRGQSFSRAAGAACGS